MKQYKFVDLFAGCGGLSLGLQQAGFTPWFVNEIVEQFCNTYKYNHELSDDHYFVGDIADLNQHLDEYKNLLSDITLVCGGPPCQGFSMANRQRILDDPRNSLYKQYLIFLQNVRPKFFIMENVKGMMNKIEEIKENFKEYLGEEYQFDYALVKAQDYGVPQNRERIFVISIRRDGEENFHYNFPKAEKLTLRIADILQDSEDKTLYISKSLSDGLIRKTNANEVSSPKIIHIGDLPIGAKFAGKQRVFSIHGISPTLMENMYKDPKNYGCIPKVVVKNKVRKLSPFECFALMGVHKEDDYKLCNSGLKKNKAIQVIR